MRGDSLRATPNSAPSICIAAGLAASLALLLAHAWVYAFLTDDAYISFRYARNLVNGYGLVFNPGFERVEGYTNFLWVLLLALAHAAGASLPAAAYALSIAATIGLWAVVVALARRVTPRERMGWIVLPPLLLAATRSVAVWSTGGLETRLFELLVVGGLLRLLVEDDRLSRGARIARPYAALLFALATWTRPDGLLISLSVGGAVTLVRLRHLPERARWMAISAGLFSVLVGGHLLFRQLYYGSWVPNTYYAKVGGNVWWASGFQYLTAFAIEYAVWLWIPFLVAGVLWHVRHGTAIVPIACGAIVLPHALYVASVGGDHFEYRPLDLYFPLAFLLIAAGAMFLARTRLSSALTLVTLFALVLLAAELPFRSHVQFPSTYASGFPGSIVSYRQDSLPRILVIDDARGFLDPDRNGLYRLPGLRALAAAHRRIVREGTAHFVGIRQEEHRLFLGTVVGEGRRLGTLVAEGRIPARTYVALDCVGAIPFYSDLRVLDRLGLTDAHVARQEFAHPEVMAHGKYATPEYTRERRVELWAVDNVHLLWDVRDPTFLEAIVALHANRIEAYFARIDEWTVLGALLPTGPRAVAASMGALRFERLAEPEVAARLARLAIPSFRSAVLAHPEIADAHSSLALALLLTGDLSEAEAELETAMALDPDDSVANNNLARLLVARGQLREALPHLERSVKGDPENPRLRVNLGKVLLALGQPERALLQFEQAQEQDPDDDDARRGVERARQLLRPD